MSKSKLQIVEETFHSSIADLSEKLLAFPWHEKAAYVCWVGQTYRLVRHTTRLLCISAGMCTMEDDELHRKSIWHLKEEWGHDEIAIADLRALGTGPDEIVELPQTSAIYQSQYYFLNRYGAYSILGYSYMLEGLAAAKGKEVTDMLTNHYGPKACRFMRVHAEEDGEHVRQGLDFLSKLDERELDGILINIVQSQVTYGLMLKAAAEFGKKSGTGTNQKNKAAA